MDFNLDDFYSLLKRGSMFILSENHFKDLLVAGGFVPTSFDNESMIDILDIGAGDGEVGYFAIIPLSVQLILSLLSGYIAASQSSYSHGKRYHVKGLCNRI